MPYIYRNNSAMMTCMGIILTIILVCVMLRCVTRIFSPRETFCGCKGMRTKWHRPPYYNYTRWGDNTYYDLDNMADTWPVGAPYDQYKRQAQLDRLYLAKVRHRKRCRAVASGGSPPTPTNVPTVTTPSGCSLPVVSAAGMPATSPNPAGSFQSPQEDTACAGMNPWNYGIGVV